MQIKQFLKFYRYARAGENYLLLVRVIWSAWLVQRALPNGPEVPELGAVLSIIDRFYLSPQPNWRISDAKKIAWFANFIVNFPFRWGRCLQRSLIVYRLLNGYGMPTRLLIGVPKKNPASAGHVWVTRLSDGQEAFAEAVEPREQYTPIYSSALP